MHQVLLLLEDETHRSLLEEWLSALYPVVLPAGDALPGPPFDLFVVDCPALARHHAWVRQQVEAARPAALPVLMVLPHGGVGDIPPALRGDVDEVITSPLERAELLARLQALSRLRHLSLELKLTQEKITRISKAIESTSDAVSIASVNGTAMYHNQAFIDLYGFTVNELNVKGIPNALFVVPDKAREVFETVQQGQTWSGEVSLKTKGGRLVPTLLRADLIRDDAGEPIAFISVCTDITERKRAEAAEREQRTLAEALRDTAAALTSTLDLDEVLDRILANVGRVVPHDTAYVVLLEAGGARLVRSRGYAEAGLEPARIAERFAIADHPLLRRMAETGQPVAVFDVQTGAFRDRHPPAASWLRAYVGAPIHLSGAVIGFLGLHSATPGFFGQAHAGRLQTFADQAAIAIQNAQFHEQARALAALEERQRLARDLHDAVSQTLFSASVIAGALPRLWERNPAKVPPRLEQLHRLTRGALAEMRALLMELRPSALTEAHLGELLQQLGEAVMGRSQMAVTLAVEDVAGLPPDVQMALYYIAQEALNNVVKHARANEAAVRLHNGAEGLRLSIHDDGRGFDPDRVPNTCMGLRIMGERAASIGAALSITSAPGAGTTLEVIWPGGGEGALR